MIFSVCDFIVYTNKFNGRIIKTSLLVSLVHPLTSHLFYTYNSQAKVKKPTGIDKKQKKRREGFMICSWQFTGMFNELGWSSKKLLVRVMHGRSSWLFAWRSIRLSLTSCSMGKVTSTDECIFSSAKGGQNTCQIFLFLEKCCPTKGTLLVEQHSSGKYLWKNKNIDFFCPIKHLIASGKDHLSDERLSVGQIIISSSEYESHIRKMRDLACVYKKSSQLILRWNLNFLHIIAGCSIYESQWLIRVSRIH